MTTLYDLLGALCEDGADELRTAFRRAVKGVHPDLNPGDPDAALKFRQIVRANEILSDGDQRAAYDHLLTLADQERTEASRHRFAATVHKLASSIMALCGLAIMTAGGYLLFMHISVASVGPGTLIGAEGGATSLAAEPADAAPAPDTVIAANPDPAGDLTGSIARSYRARALAAYREGNLNGAIADLDEAIQVDPKFSAAYIDRATIFFRLRNSRAARAFGTPGHAVHAKPVAAAASAKPAPIRLPQPSPWRAAAQDREWRAGLISAR